MDKTYDSLIHVQINLDMEPGTGSTAGFRIGLDFHKTRVVFPHISFSFISCFTATCDGALTED